MSNRPRFLTREEILGTQDLPTEVVEVPEWGGAVKVRGLTVGERDRLAKGTISFDSQGRPRVNSNALVEARLRIVALCTLGEDDKPLFSEADIKALEEKSPAPIDRIFATALRLSGWGAEGQGN